SDEKEAELAYIISEASTHVLNGAGGTSADDYGAATAIIVHDWTNAEGLSKYDPQDALDHFAPADGSQGPHSWQQSGGVVPTYNKLIEDAQKYSGTWDLTLDAVTQDVVLGQDVVVTGTLWNSTRNEGVPGHDVTLEAQGGDLSARNVETD